MKCGFVGLGDQGGPIPYRLQNAGHEVAVWARRPEATQPYAEAGILVSEDLPALARACDWIGICVFDDAGVRQVCAELMPHMRQGGMIVVHSTIHPETCRLLSEHASAHGLEFVDAPVSGGNVRAKDGTLTIMIGASDEAFAKSGPILEAYGSVIVRVGPPGAGQTAKLVNNTLLVAHAAIAQAAIEAGKQLNLDPASLVNIVNASSGRSYGFELFGAIGAEGFGRITQLLNKDVGLLRSIAPADAPIQRYIELTDDFLATLPSRQ
jgi:3-hydroxyisobutyrate dehydrogenase-like beta-hydroxyacid dehydrogenase